MSFDRDVIVTWEIKNVQVLCINPVIDHCVATIVSINTIQWSKLKYFLTFWNYFSTYFFILNMFCSKDSNFLIHWKSFEKCFWHMKFVIKIGNFEHWRAFLHFRIKTGSHFNFLFQSCKSWKNRSLFVHFVDQNKSISRSSLARGLKIF